MRLLIVSHPAVLAVNQLPYAALREYGWDPFIVVPARWCNDYTPTGFAPEVHAELSGRVAGRRVLLPGRQQRHAYLSTRDLREVRPHVMFIEQEPTSVAAAQWGWAARRAGVPFGLAQDENLDRAYPLPARVFRRRALHDAAFVAARSPRAAALIGGVRAPLIPHHVPEWPAPVRARRETFVIGYAGRLVEQKGLDVLVDAAAGLDGTALRCAGDGPLRATLLARGVEVMRVPHAEMARAYAGFDVLVLPSRTTPTWSEQFGRVLVEALWCGVPVVGSDSGEIPWVIEATGGGLLFPEGDVRALRAILIALRDDPARRRELAQRGRARVRAHFSVQAVARRLDAALREAASSA